MRHLVEIAERNKLERVFGIIDGDGRSFANLAPRFDAPYRGPLFDWKAYCIENLLVQTGWPQAWGDEPDWQVELGKYAPYVALNRMTKELGAALETLGIARHTNPAIGRPVLSAFEIVSRLAAGKHSLLSYDVEDNFRRQVSDFEGLIAGDLNEVHAFLNGKWIVEHMAPTITGRTPDRCREDWINHARLSGGSPEVRDWWDRIAR